LETREFYTNAQSWGKNILLRGIRDGEPFKEKVPYKPYHFVKSKNNKPTEYKNLDGKFLSRLDFDDIKEAKAFSSKYEGMASTFPIYGYSKYVYNFLSDTYKNQTTYTEEVSVVYFDIEVAGNHYEPVHLVRLEDDTITTIGELRFYPGKKVWDETRSEFVEQSASRYLKPNGFPYADQARNPVTAISLRKGKQIYVLSTVFYEVHRDDVIHIPCKNEKELILEFLKLWKVLNPDIISGWNISYFDIPYMVNRMRKIFGESAANQLSPWSILREFTSLSKYGKEQVSYKILGISVLDLMQAYIKFSFKNHESFTLNYIAHVELKEKKIDYSQYASLYDLYLKDPQLFIEYNIQDTDLVARIDQKTGLINQIMELAYSAGVNYEDAFTSVLFWEVKIKNRLEDKGIIVPSNVDRTPKLRKNMGAYVKPPIPAKYKWVIGLDLDSLYPHLIMQYNISPETLVSYQEELLHIMSIDDILKGDLLKNENIAKLIKEQNCGYTPNGCFFRNDIQGFLAEIMREEYNLRKHYKKLMIEAKKEFEKTGKNELEGLISKYNNMQMARKIAINAAYGALSNEYCLWFQIELAEAITYSGQLVIKYIGIRLNEYLNKLFKTNNLDYIIAQDTDSCYLTFDRLIELIMPGETNKSKIVDFLVKVTEEKINPFIEKCYEDLKTYTNAYEQKMSMKTESISDFGIWKAKKRYALNVYWDEGVKYEEPKLKIRGIEAVQSTTPAICRDAIKKCLTLMLSDNKEELYKFVDQFKAEFKASSFEAVATTTGVHELNKYNGGEKSIYAKGTPIHVRASLLYNYYTKKEKIDDIYQKIMAGDKMKYCYMKLPNPVKENVFGIFNKLPPELKLEKYIDYNRQFEAEFINPVNSIAKILGWDIQHKENIREFME
jgi:DNA polymerase elongation subunit (family B)